jgi:hypothetical protein
MSVSGNYTIKEDYPYCVFATGQTDDVLLYNSGTVNLYLDDQPYTTVTTGFLMQPNDTKVWNANDPLYVISKPGEVGQLTVSNNSGALFSPTSIGTAIQVSGVPPIDIATALLALFSTVPNSGTGDTSATVVMGRYQSVRVFWSGPAVSGTPLTTQSITLNWKDTNGTDLYAPNFNPYVYEVADKTGFMDLSIQPPIGAAQLSVTWGTNAGGIITPATLVITGSYKTLPVPIVRIGSPALSNTSGTVLSSGLYGLFSQVVTASTAATTDYPIIRAGKGTLSVHHNGTGTSTIDVAILDLNTGRRIVNLVTSAGAEISATAAGGGSMDVTLPANQVSMFVNVRGTVPSTLNVSLAMMP